MKQQFLFDLFTWVCIWWGANYVGREVLTSLLTNSVHCGPRDKAIWKLELLFRDRDTHTSSWVSYPTLSSGPSASAEEAKIMPRLPSTASCFCPRSQSKSYHVFAAFCILLFFYSGPLFPSFSNYLPNKSHSLIDTSTETPKAQERIRCKVHESEVCIRWICSWGRNYPLLLQCVCLHILRSTKPTS